MREQRRALFDSVAELYDAVRQGYPAEMVDAVMANAVLGRGGAVLEIGCGTGQLTRQLAGRGLSVTAIDIGMAMVAAARRNVTDATVQFKVCSFEDFAGSGPFDLIMSATAFHWVDPAVGLVKAARLLRPRGWLALPSTGALCQAARQQAARAMDEIQPPEQVARPAGLADSTARERAFRRDCRGEPHQGPAPSRGNRHGCRTNPRHLPQLHRAEPGEFHRRPEGPRAARLPRRPRQWQAARAAPRWPHGHRP